MITNDICCNFKTGMSITEGDQQWGYAVTGDAKLPYMFEVTSSQLFRKSIAEKQEQLSSEARKSIKIYNFHKIHKARRMVLTAKAQSFSQVAFNLLKSLSNETITR